MIRSSTRVCVYIFEMDDGRSAGQRLQQAAAHYCGEGMEELRIERTAAGKPYFPDYPGLHFSISHSGAYWACAMSEVNVGLDLQEHTRAKNETREEAAVRFRKMAHRFFHPVEAAFVEGDSYSRFFTVWTAREAYVKNTGQGIDKYFSEHCVVPDTAPKDPSEDWLVGSWTAMGKWFRKAEYKAQYSLCVCAQEPFEWVIHTC